MKLRLSELDGTNGFRLDGVDTYDWSGVSVAGAGDVNGDGFSDVIIGAYWGDPNVTDAGESYVVFGAATGFDARRDLSTLDGTDGFRLDGIEANDRSGRSVSGAGDVNGDGFDDIIVGAFLAAPNGVVTGASYVVFGTADGFAASLDLSALDGTNGFRIDGADRFDASGVAVSSAGDVNNDGIDDIIVGAFGADASSYNSGASYVVFGTADGFAASLDLSALDGTNGFRLEGADPDDMAGISVSGAGDVNGDGIDDVIVGAYKADPDGLRTGASYVVFGAEEGIAPSLRLAALDGTDGFRIDGVELYDDAGVSVSSAGDVNGDGFDDIVVGAESADGNGSFAGAGYVVFGAATGFGASVELADLDGTNGFRLKGLDGGDFAGISVSGAGDFNGDGFDDIIIGAPGSDAEASRAGESYLLFGAAAGFEASFDPTAIDGTNGLRITGALAGDASGRSVSGAGDVNGDGFDDLIIGAPYADPNGLASGASFVVFGFATTGTGNNAPVAQDDAVRVEEDTVLAGNVLSDNGNGEDSDPDGDPFAVSQVNGSAANVGQSVTLASGVLLLNPDGSFRYEPNEDFNGRDSFTYTIADDRNGRDTATVAITVDPDGDLDFVGSSRGERIVGTPDDDTLNGAGGHDTILGKAETDELFGELGQDVVRGGGGDDLVNGGGGDDTISGDNGRDIMLGKAGDDVLIGGRGADVLDGGDGGDTMEGGPGDDTYFVEDQRDRITEAAGEGIDLVISWSSFRLKANLEDLILQGASLSERVFGIGNDLDNTITGDDSNNLLKGRTGNDTLNGGDGDDRLLDRKGVNVLIGGEDDDTYIMNGSSVVIEALWSGTDRVIIREDYTLPDNVEILRLKGGADLDGTGNDGDNGLRGTSGDNTLSGRVGADVLQGRGGEDTLLGGVGDDTLKGGKGADLQIGGAGDDQLIAHSGEDTLTGGAGQDFFRFAGDFSVVTITDFEDAEDRIAFTNLRSANGGDPLTFDQLLVNQAGTDTTIELDLDENDTADEIDLDNDGVADAVRIDLLDFAAADLSADDFKF